MNLKNKIINIVEDNEIFGEHDFDYLWNYVSEDIKKIGYKECNKKHKSQINIVDKTIAQEFLDKKEDLVEDYWFAHYWFLNKKQIRQVSDLLVTLNKIYNSELEGELILFRLDKKNYV